MAILSLLFNIEWTTLLFVTLITYIANYYIRYFTRENALPGPIPLPLIGNLHQQDKDLAVFCEKLREKYGDICEVYLGSAKYIFISRADLAEQIYGNSSSSGKNAFMLRSPPNKQGLDELGLLDKGMLYNQNLDVWKFNRRIVSQTIMTPRFLRGFVKSTQELFREVEQYWNILSGDEETKTIQFSEWASAFAMESTVKMTTGTKVYSLANYFNSLVKDKQKRTKHPETVLKESVEYVERVRMRIQATMFFLSIPPFIRHYFPIISQYNQMYLDNAAWLNNQLMEFINERKREIENTKNIDELVPDLLTLLLTTNTDKDLNKIATGEFSRPLTDDEVIANCNEIFPAGIATNASLLCSVVYYIYHNPEVKRKLLQELDSLNLSSPDQELSYDQVDNLRYLEAIIKESSRIAPPVAAFFRCSIEETTIANVKFPAHSMFFTNFKGIHRHPQHWERPLEFDPDRFFLNKDKIVKSSFLPFGGGVRICPGRHWAMTKMKTFMAVLYLKYDVELVDKEAPLRIVNEPIARCYDLNFVIKPRSDVAQ